MNEPYADYVFGRMMKVGCDIGENSITVRSEEPQWDYQGWSGHGPNKYPTYAALASAAVLSLAAGE